MTHKAQSICFSFIWCEHYKGSEKPFVRATPFSFRLENSSLTGWVKVLCSMVGLDMLLQNRKPEQYKVII